MCAEVLREERGRGDSSQRAVRLPVPLRGGQSGVHPDDDAGTAEGGVVAEGELPGHGEQRV